MERSEKVLTDGTKRFLEYAAEQLEGVRRLAHLLPVFINCHDDCVGSCLDAFGMGNINI
jgi:hypothetical protein